MAIAAVPNYLGFNFQTASPGLRFGMYLPTWRQDWSKEKDTASLLKGKVCPLNDRDQNTLAALRVRQTALANTIASDALLTMDAQSIAPFSTGLGNEHPLENGFAFLNPYGLPYLPGSGVKGVLRQAARELANGDWGDTQGWTDSAIFALFGHQAGETELVRGALSFWDVIPQLAGDTLAVDIMTPHQGHYYKKNGETPHESGQPNPISFLTVPPKSGFVFYVQCDVPHLQRLAPELAQDNRWRELLESAFLHAFNWLGFGAKTSVGYGAMRENPEIAQQRAAEKEKRLKQQQAAAAQLARDALPSDQRLLAELDTELQKLPRNPQDNKPIQQQTSTQHWTAILAKLQDLSAQLGAPALPVRERLAAEVKERLLTHFKVEGKAEKAMKQALAALRGIQ
jgi:CRISPR-associated protein Cmr6